MFNLKDPNISYIILSGDISAPANFLYSRDYYHIIEMSSYMGGNFNKSFIAVSNSIDRSTMRNDTVQLMHLFNESDVVLKYMGETTPIKILEDGSEQPMGLVMYNTDSNLKSYIYEGISFSFTEKQLYYFPKKKEDFKEGMLIEYQNNNKWCEKRIFNVETEYENMYKLLIKYGRIRIPV